MYKQSGLLRPKLTSPFFNVHVCLGSGRDSPSLKLPYMSRAEAVKPWQPGQRLSVRNWTIKLPSQHKTPSPSEPRQDVLVKAGRCYSTYLPRLLKPRWWISCYICRTTWQIVKNYNNISSIPQTAGEFKNIICVGLGTAFLKQMLQIITVNGFYNLLGLTMLLGNTAQTCSLRLELLEIDTRQNAMNRSYLFSFCPNHSRGRISSNWYI